MIRVTIVEDERIIQSVSAEKNVLMAWAQENEKSPGYCIFSLSGEIRELVDRDDVFELLVRAALNAMELRGVKIAYCKSKSLFDGLKKLGFTEKNDCCEVVIKDFFKPCCGK